MTCHLLGATVAAAALQVPLDAQAAILLAAVALRVLLGGAVAIAAAHRAFLAAAVASLVLLTGVAAAVAVGQRALVAQRALLQTAEARSRPG